MHGIQLSREFEAPSTSIRRVDSFTTHVERGEFMKTFFFRAHKDRRLKSKFFENGHATVPDVVRFQCWSIILALKVTPNRATTENNTTQLHSRIT